MESGGLGSDTSWVAAPSYACPVCGERTLKSKPYERWSPSTDFDDLAPPYEDHLGKPSYEVCRRCGFEFGNDDNPGTASPQTIAEFRREWRERGSPAFE